MRCPSLGSRVSFKPSFVDQHVCLQLVRVGEITWTKLALKEKISSCNEKKVEIYLVWTLSRVNPEMSSQICDLNKLAVAMCAVVRLLPRVQTHVSLQVVVPCKSFMAFLTFKRFLSRVCSLVVL